ncbi:pentatricopeptide repeat-containing protein at5g50280 chloroplastic [Phtheirospermum japonicum]|uniref:Pentatricopeptide repeat-containing protein at5g50280 chloroplastic n=1 Tax=Phtheirospermum japonicum TaxID=374723 RepID=A0A830CY02_9LAMI|nr:pentatricopeptide repeat-containing protein at5g50280 chloroplastic [Phtheirospermum japonicum]
MALAPLNFHSHFSISSSSSCSFSSLYVLNFQTPLLSKIPKQLQNPRKTFCISSSTPAPQSSPIFLPFLQTPARKQTLKPEPQNEIEIESIDDPILKFFKTQASDPSPDPNREGRIPLQKNRKTSWHLAPTFDNTEPVSETSNYQTPISQQPEETISGAAEGVVEKILGIARALPENVTMGEALERCDFGGRLGEMECVEVLRVLGEEGNVMGCLYFFEWMGLREPCLVSPKACSVLFPVLGKAGKGDELLVMFKNLPFQQNKEFMDVRVYNAAISGLLFCGRYDDAWEVYELIETSNIRPDHVTCSIMITIMRKRGDSAKDSFQFFEKMTKKGVKWSLEAVGALIKSFCDEGLKKEALIIQSELEKRGISSNVIIYNTIMDAYNKSNQIEEAEGLFAEMKTKKIQPTAATYNILMDAYSRRMQPEIVEKLLQEMEINGLEPNVRSYTCLISAYGRQKKMSDMAADAFLRMKKKIEGTRITFNILLDGFAKQGHYVEARDVICEFGKIGFRPNVMTYNMLINAYARGGQESKLPMLLKEMAALNLKPDSVTYSTMIYSYLRVRDFRRAFFYHKQMVKSGQVPDARAYQKLRAILDVKAKIKNRKDKSALMGIIKSSMGLMKEKKKGKKDEFWKNRTKRKQIIPRSAPAPQ